MREIPDLRYDKDRGRGKFRETISRVGRHLKQDDNWKKYALGAAIGVGGLTLGSKLKQKPNTPNTQNTPNTSNIPNTQSKSEPTDLETSSTASQTTKPDIKSNIKSNDKPIGTAEKVARFILPGGLVSAGKAVTNLDRKATKLSDDLVSTYSPAGATMRALRSRK